jgi:hypothetical protein
MTGVSMHAVRGFRMRRQHLIERSGPGTLLQAIEAVHGIQAQIQAHAYFAVAQRVQKVTSTEIDRALWQDRSLIKTWAMRGTVHWLPRTEEPLFSAGLIRLRADMHDEWWARKGLPPARRQQLLQTIVDIIGEEPKTRQEVAALARDVVDPRWHDWLSSSWGGLYASASLRGMLVFGPPRGNNVLFAKRESWLGGIPEIDPDTAALEMIRRYLRSYGPATFQDLAHWLGITQNRLKPFWDRIEDERIPVTTDGTTRWLLASDIDALREMEGAKLPVRLLPAFDPLLLAHRDKTEILPAEHYKRIYGAAAWVYPAVLVHGQIYGTWTYQRKARHIEVTVHPFRTIGKAAQAAIEREATHLAKAIARTAVVTYAD